MLRSSMKTWILVLGAVALCLVAIALLGVYWFIKSGGTRPIDNMFGDQHLKTTVALVELHRTRYGVYPRALSELKFSGQWDAIALQAVSYCAAEDRQSYFVTVMRGWAGQPELTMPAEFWRGTGFNPRVGPCHAPR